MITVVTNLPSILKLDERTPVGVLYLEKVLGEVVYDYRVFVANKIKLGDYIREPERDIFVKVIGLNKIWNEEVEAEMEEGEDDNDI